MEGACLPLHSTGKADISSCELKVQSPWGHLPIADRPLPVQKLAWHLIKYEGCLGFSAGQAVPIGTLIKAQAVRPLPAAKALSPKALK
jgi:hypothetical protein